MKRQQKKDKGKAYLGKRPTIAPAPGYDRPEIGGADDAANDMKKKWRDRRKKQKEKKGLENDRDRIGTDPDPRGDEAPHFGNAPGVGTDDGPSLEHSPLYVPPPEWGPAN
jgi:hypothetical protein